MKLHAERPNPGKSTKEKKPEKKLGRADTLCDLNEGTWGTWREKSLEFSPTVKSVENHMRR